MRKGWKSTTFSDAPVQIIDGDRGKNYPKQTDFADAGFCVFLNTSNVTESGFNFTSVQFINEAKDDALRKGKLTCDDVVMTTRGTIGNVAYYNANVAFDHMRINSGMVIFRYDQSQLSPLFLYHYLRSPSFHGQVNSLRSGVAQPQLPIRDIKRIELPLPSLAEQSHVAELIANYDDLIENNLRRMALLEESARLLYREWFVRLRFPGHEHTRIVNGVPEGWERSSIKEFGEVVTGKTPSTRESDNYGGDIPFIKTPDMHDQVFIISTEAYLSEKGANTQRGKYVPENTLLVSCIGTIGVVALTSKVAQFNQQINAVIPFEEHTLYYSFFAFKDLKERMEAIGGGATMGNINKSKFENLEVLKPNFTLLWDFHEFCKPVFAQIKTLSFQNQKLKSARDPLLPRLMSGEIAV